MNSRLAPTMVLIMLLLGVEYTHSDVYKTSEMTAAVNFNLAVERFQKLKKAPPRSWTELADVAECTTALGAVEKESPDFQKVHRFLESSKPVHISVAGLRVGDTATKARVVAMGIGHAAPTRSQAEGENFRNVILEYGGGEIRYVRMNEPKLKAAFEVAGFRLEDYSGINGEWEPETLQHPILPKQPYHSHVQPHAPLSINQNILNQDTSTILSTWKWILVVTVILLSIIGLWFGVRNRIR